MIRCVAYYGDVHDELAGSDLERIVNNAQIRNAKLGITGCLFYFGSHFIQVLEGRFDDVDALYATIVSQDRHPNVIGLVDHVVQAREFPNWSMRFVCAANPHRSTTRHTRPARSIAPWDAMNDVQRTPSAVRLARKLDRQISSRLRVAPQQPRAKETVDRLLDAVSEMVFRESHLDRLTLETVAGEAGVTQQSAYRYFANIGDLIRTMVRRRQVNWHARFLEFMAGQAFESEAQIADAVVAFIAQTYETQVAASAKLKRDILRSYHDIEYEAAWTVSDAICESVAGVGGSSLHVGVPEMAAGLVALWAVSKSLLLRDATQMGRPAVRDMMADIFLAALGGPPGSNGDRLARLI
ncbi:MAG: BLUF domain-containing protein [Allosphingosinicella sp.]